MYKKEPGMGVPGKSQGETAGRFGRCWASGLCDERETKHDSRRTGTEFTGFAEVAVDKEVAIVPLFLTALQHRIQVSEKSARG